MTPQIAPMFQVKLNSMTISADQVDSVLSKIPLQDGYRLHLVVLDGVKGNRAYNINERGKVLDSGRNLDSHWLAAEYAFRASGQDNPHAIAHKGDSLVKVYSLEQWEIKSLGYSKACDHLSIGVEIDRAGFLSCRFCAASAQQFADQIQAANDA